MTAFAIANGTMGAQIGQATTDAGGNFTIPIGDYSGPMMIQASGGTYTDEATDTSMPMLSGDVMTCAVSSVEANGATSGIQITPLTSMAQAMARNMAGGMTAANIDKANGAVGTTAAGTVGRSGSSSPSRPTNSSERS